MTEPLVTSNTRIAKNAVMLYIRMFFTMLIGLYTSRVVLATLGEVDYGIYGVVGGIVAMMGFLNASMSGATSRFLTFELGRGDKDRLARTFSSAMIVHIGIALVVLVLAETVGLWFLCNKLVIPAERMTAAHWVYQLSIASAMLSITQVPYNSAIIAHEKMDVYAYVEILNSVLKLAIVFLLVIGKQDKLILYAVLYFSVSVLILGIYRIYCIRRFEESHIKWCWDKEILKPLLSFSGWDLYGNACNTIRVQGVNFLINIFFGVVYNAASSLASTIQGVLFQLAHNILTAYRPQIISRYAAGDCQSSMKLIYSAAKLCTLLFVVFSLPIYLCMDTILGLWLEKVPVMTDTFCRLMIISGWVNVFACAINIGNHATGKVAKMSIYSGTTYLASVLVVWVSYKIGMSIEYAYFIGILANVVLLIIYSLILKSHVAEFSLSQEFYRSLLPIFVTVVAVAIPMWLMMKYWQIDSHPFICFTISFLLVVISSIAFGLSAHERVMIRDIVKRKILKK